MLAFDENKKIGLVADLPIDAVLPGLPTVLNAEKMAAILYGQTQGKLGEIKSCEITYIRYKPYTGCLTACTLNCLDQASQEPRQIVFYSRLYNREHFEQARQKITKFRWVDLYGFDPVITLPDERAIIFFYPNDCLISGLKLLSDPRKIRRVLYEHYHKYPSANWRISPRKKEICLVRYKPERRAVLRYDSKATDLITDYREKFGLYFRAYGDDRGKSIYALHENLWNAIQASRIVTVPRPVVFLPEYKLLIMEEIPGRPLLEFLNDENSAKSICAAAQGIAVLHDFEVPDIPISKSEDLIENAESTAALLTFMTPENENLISDIMECLKSKMTDADKSNVGFVHGDFYYGQVLLQDGKAAIIDFDRSYAGNQLADIGNFCAHLRHLQLDGRLAESTKLENYFIESYETAIAKRIVRNNLSFWMALGLFELSIGPFRRLEKNWRDKIRAILEECRMMLK